MKSFLLVFAGCLLILAVLTIPIRAQEPFSPTYQSASWVYTGGPQGGLGYDIRMDPRNPDVMYVTDAEAGVFKSVDGGHTWFPINQGITARVGTSNDSIPVFSLTIDPNRPDTLWVGTQFGGGIFRSDDAGATWRPMNNGIQEQGLTIRGFTVEPGNSDVVYLGGEVPSWSWSGDNQPGVLLDRVKGVVYKTTDGGQHWERIWYGDNLARYIWVHPEDHNLIYVSTGIFDREAANSNPSTKDPGGVGILRSHDGGKTWEVLGVANGIRADELYFGSLYMNPKNPNILLGAAGNDPYMWVLGRPIGAIYRTADGGDTWTRVLDLPNASTVEICEGDPDVVYAGSLSGFYRSDDGGLTWQQLAGGLWGPEDVAAGFPIDLQCDPRNPMRIFVNNYVGGNFLSEDGGQTWVTASKGYTGALMNQVAVAQDNPALVYATARSGVFVSENGGETWRGLSRGVARPLEAVGLAVNPFDSQHIIVTISDAGPLPKVSHNGGQTWSQAQIPTLDPAQWALPRKIFFSPTQPGYVWATSGDTACETPKTCNIGYGVGYSTDGGETWNLSTLKDGDAMDLAFGPDGSVYAALYPGNIYRSEDNGATWEALAEQINSAFEITDPDMPGPSITALAVSSRDPHTLIAGFRRGGVMVSHDGGRTWAISSAGLAPETEVLDLLADPAHPGVVYLAAADSGVFISRDDGETWQALNDGLGNRAVVSLALSWDEQHLYAAVVGGGVWRLDLNGQPPASAPAPEQSTEPASPPTPEATVSEPAGKSNGGGLPCLGGFVPLVLVGLAWVGISKSKSEQ